MEPALEPPGPSTEVPPEALAPTSPPPLRPGRLALQLGAATPAHLASSGLVLAAACSGEIVRVECGKTLKGSGGALAATGIALALLPPLASGAIVYGLGGDEAHTPSFFWTVGAGAAAQALGFGLALATGEPAVGVLSVTLMPVAAEVVAARLSLQRDPIATPGAIPPGPGAAAPAGSDRQLVILPVAAFTF